MKRLTAVLFVAAALPLVACNSSQKTQADTASMGAMNTKCPIMPDHKIDPAVTTDYKGGKVAFCCKGCIPKWNAATDADKAKMADKAK